MSKRRFVCDEIADYNRLYDPGMRTNGFICDLVTDGIVEPSGMGAIRAYAEGTLTGSFTDALKVEKQLFDAEVAAYRMGIRRR